MHLHKRSEQKRFNSLGQTQIIWTWLVIGHVLLESLKHESDRESDLLFASIFTHLCPCTCTLVVEDYRRCSGQAFHRLHLHTAVQGQLQDLLWALFPPCVGISIATTSFRYCWKRNSRCTQQTRGPYIASIYIYSCRDMICSASGKQ